MKEIGQLLREKREAAGVSLEEVSAATKINIKILNAVEEGDLTKLPSKTFVRGFVQTYAKYLGLNSDEILLKLQEILGSTRPNPHIQTRAEPEANPEQKFQGQGTMHGRSWITGAVIVSLILGIILVQKVVSKREAELKTSTAHVITGNDAPVELPTPVKTDVSGGIATADTTAIATAPAAATTSPSPSPTAAAAAAVAIPSPTPAPTAAKTLAAAPPPKPTPVIAVTPTPKPSAPAPTPTPVPTPTPAESPSVPQTVIVEALDSVNIKVTIDGKGPQDFNLSADQIQTFKAKGKIRISTSNGGAISIIHNGREIGVPGNLGQPKTLAFP